MDRSVIAAYLPTPSQLGEALVSSASFRDFSALVEKSSGEHPARINPAKAAYRISDALNGARLDLHLDDPVMSAGGPCRIADLIALNLQIERSTLAYSVWALQNFTDLKLWLKGMKALVRFSYDLENKLQGHLLLAETLIPMVETVERREYVLANGDMASDAITRNLGLRAKVFALDRARRAQRPLEDGGILDRLSRTLSRINNR
jgi:hypothetical protein